MDIPAFEITETPSSKEIDLLTQAINQDYKQYGTASPFAIFLRDQNQTILAGCNGSIIYGTIYTDQIWVSPTLRQKGIGKKLMETVHDLGKKKQCRLATVTTMDFQVSSFYIKLGYHIDFTRQGYQNGSTCLYLSKNLY